MACSARRASSPAISARSTTRSSSPRTRTTPSFSVEELTLPIEVPMDRLSNRLALRSGLARPCPAQRVDRRGPRPGRLPAQGALAPDLVRDAAGLRHPGRGPTAPRPLRANALRPERAAGPPAGRGRRPVRDRLLFARHRRLGHAQHNFKLLRERLLPTTEQTLPTLIHGPRVAAACSTRPWSSGRASSAAPRRSTRTPDATTGRSATPCSWPAAA